jgi:hypothetical protein
MSKQPLFDIGGKKKPRAYAYMAVHLLLLWLCIQTRHPLAFVSIALFIFLVGAFDYRAMGLGGPFGMKRPGPEKPWQD